MSDLIDDCDWHHHWSSSFSRRGNIVNHGLKVLKILHFSCPHTEFHTVSWWFILLLFCSLDSQPLNTPSVVFQDFISVEILIVLAKSLIICWRTALSVLHTEEPLFTCDLGHILSTQDHPSSSSHLQPTLARTQIHTHAQSFTRADTPVIHLHHQSRGRMCALSHDTHIHQRSSLLSVVYWLNQRNKN